MREIERRTQIIAATDISSMKIPERPVGELDNFDKQVDLLFDLIAIAYQADLTRVASYIMVAEGTNQTYNHIGVPDSFHPDLPPCQRSAERSNKLVKIQTWHMEPLRRVPEEDGGDATTATARCWITRSSCTDRTWATATSTATGRFRPSSSAAATAR